MRFRVTALLVGLACLPIAAALPDSDGELQQRVRQAAMATYIHGMTAEIADTEVGMDGVPVLLELLADPSFPRRDNVVAMLSFLGGSETTEALTSFLQSPPAIVEIPEEQRALLLTPQALGHIAANGDRTALDLLLKITDPTSGNDLLRGAAFQAADPYRLHTDLFRMALRGLAYTGAGEADLRLLGIARGELNPPALPDAHADARDALALRETLKTITATNDLRTTTNDGQSTLAGGSLDTSPEVHDSGLSYANHVEVSDPMDNPRLDLILDAASLRAGRGDDTTDVSCCMTISRSGSAASFGSPGDGLDTIDDQNEMNAVLDDTVSRVKIVSAINYCGGPGVNTLKTESD